MDSEYNRYYIKIRTTLGINPKKIHKELAVALGSKALSYPTVAEWAKRFRDVFIHRIVLRVELVYIDSATECVKIALS